MNNRREFIALLGGAAAWPQAARAQQAASTVRRIGFLLPGGPRTTVVRGQLEAFHQGLKEYGWIEGQNISVEYRFAEGKEDALPGIAAELVRLRLDVIGQKARRQSGRRKLSRKPSQSSWRRAPIRLELAWSRASIGLAAT
jgi:hypothetical protein